MEDLQLEGLGDLTAAAPTVCRQQQQQQRPVKSGERHGAETVGLCHFEII